VSDFVHVYVCKCVYCFVACVFMCACVCVCVCVMGYNKVYCIMLLKCGLHVSCE